MNPSASSALTRWILLTPAVLLLALATALLAIFLLHWINLASDSFIGASIAVEFVAVAYVVAPRLKILVATFFFFLGALLAWHFLKNGGIQMDVPPPGYIGSRQPLHVAWLAGLLTLMICAAYSLLRSPHQGARV